MSREVLAPPLLRIGPNRCYRVNLVHEDFNSQQAAAIRAQQHGQSTGNTVYAEEDLYGEDYTEEMDDVACEIEETNNGMFKLAMHVPSSFYGGIIGFKGSTKRRIESEAQCDINIPQRNATQNNSNVIIRSKTRNNVLSARRKIQLLVGSLRKKMRPTHFYGVALNFGEVKEKFKHFKDFILAEDLPGIDESLFQTENGLHLTFGVCVLMDDIERTKAVEILESCREYLNELKPPFTVRVNSLEIMNDDPRSVRVVYAVVDSPELQIFADRCFHRFNQSGLAFDDFNRDCVKLHMTVMNSRYSEKDEKTFDARAILKSGFNYDFGTVQCNELVLCAIGSTKGSDKFYKISGSLKF